MIVNNLLPISCNNEISILSKLKLYIHLIFMATLYRIWIGVNDRTCIRRTGPYRNIHVILICNRWIVTIP